MKYLKKIDKQVYHRDIRKGSGYFRALSRSPAHAQHYVLHGLELTAPMAVGSIADAWITENIFPDESIIDPKLKTCTIRNGKAFIGPPVLDDIKGMKDAIFAHPTAGKLLQKGMAQTSLFGSLNGVDCKALFDYVREPDRLAVELKTTANGSPEAFSKSILNFGMDIQLGLYLSLIEQAFLDINSAVYGHEWQWVWIVVEQKAPYSVAVYVPSERLIAQAKEKVWRLTELYKECVENDSWPGYSENIMEIDVPVWAQKGGEYE